MRVLILEGLCLSVFQIWTYLPSCFAEMPLERIIHVDEREREEREEPEVEEEEQQEEQQEEDAEEE